MKNKKIVFDWVDIITTFISIVFFLFIILVIIYVITYVIKDAKKNAYDNPSINMDITNQMMYPYLIGDTVEIETASEPITIIGYYKEYQK